MHRSLFDFRSACTFVIGLLLLTFTITAATPTAYAAGPDAGTSRLLIAEMGAIKSSAGRLSGALAKQDFESAGSQVAVLSRNWTAVREELARRDETGLIEGFELALASVQAAIEDEDGDAATASAADLGSALNDVNSTLASVDVDGGRVIQALVLPFLLIAAIAATLPGIARKLGVKL